MPIPDQAASHAPDLDELFPAGAVSVLSLSARTPGGLMPAEAAATQGFAPARLAEFAHGRNCAHRALQRLGCGVQAIAVGTNREPLWPSGVVGSISHAGHAAAAVVAWQERFTTIGLDLEPNQPLESELMHRICRPPEYAAIVATGCDPGIMARRVFSMKEAAYKALWPILRRFLDFQDLEIVVCAEASTFTVRSHSNRCPQALAQQLAGKFTQRGDLFASAVVACRASLAQD